MIIDTVCCWLLCPETAQIKRVPVSRGRPDAGLATSPTHLPSAELASVHGAGPGLCQPAGQRRRHQVVGSAAAADGRGTVASVLPLGYHISFK